jgi:carotenoid cleavage dioxygenase
VRTKSFLLERKRGRPLWTGMLERPQLDHPDGATKSTANTSLVFHAGHLLALQDQGEPYEIDPTDLDTLGPYTFQRRLRHAFCAHPKIDPGTGELLAFGASPIARPHVVYSTIAADGELTHSTAIDLPLGVWMHDFAITERYAVFMNHPYTFDIRRMLRGEPLGRFEPERGSFLGLLPRRASGNETRWFAIPPCFAFHVVNARRRRHGRARRLPPLVDRPGRRRGGRAGPGGCGAGASTRARTAGGAAARRPQRRAACASTRRTPAARAGRTSPSSAATSRCRWRAGLLKYDLDGGARTTRTAPDATAAAVFAARPGPVRRTTAGCSAGPRRGRGALELCVIDARQRRRPALARVLLPQRVPHALPRHLARPRSPPLRRTAP